MKITNNEIDAKKRDEIVEFVIDIFDRIGIQTPSNFQKIAEYIYWDVYYTGDWDNWDDGDVAFGFKRWIENQAT